MTFPTEWKNNPNVPNHQPVLTQYGFSGEKKEAKTSHFAHQENHLWKGKYGNMRINPTCLGLFQACQSLSSSSSHLASAQIHQNEVGLVRPVLQNFPGEEAWPGLFVHPKTNRDEPLSKHKSGEQPRSTESAILHLTHVAMTAEQLRQQPWDGKGPGDAHQIEIRLKQATTIDYSPMGMGQN